METRIVVKEWKIETRNDKPVITGTYAVMLGDKEIAKQEFNNQFGGTEIQFDKEINEAVKNLTVSIKQSIEELFTN